MHSSQSNQQKENNWCQIPTPRAYTRVSYIRQIFRPHVHKQITMGPAHKLYYQQSSLLMATSSLSILYSITSLASFLLSASGFHFSLCMMLLTLGHQQGKQANSNRPKNQKITQQVIPDTILPYWHQENVILSKNGTRLEPTSSIASFIILKIMQFWFLCGMPNE
jgi:hypothetical protein